MKEQTNEQTNDNSIIHWKNYQKEWENKLWKEQINDHRISIQVKTSMLSSSHNLDVYLSPSLSPRIIFFKEQVQ